MPRKPESLLSPQDSRLRVPVSPQRVPRSPRLSAKNLATLPVGDHTDAVAQGLTLRVKTTGRWWLVRYRPKRGTKRGPQRRLFLGLLGGPLALDLEALGLSDLEAPQALGLPEARDVARVIQGLAARGLDPLGILENAERARQEREAEEARRQALGLVTLGDLLERFFQEREDPPPGSREKRVRPATLRGWRFLRDGALAPLLDRDPATLSVRDVERWHEAVGASRGQTSANRALELLGTLYAWGMRTRDEDGEPLLASSPCVGVRPYPERPRSRVLDSGELRGVWEALEGEPYGDAIRLLLLTGARKNEALGAEWREVDLPARLWTVPGERSKTGEPRKIPLSAPAAAMLQDRRAADPEGRWVFPSPVASAGPVQSIQALQRRVIKRSEVEDWTLHDLRRVVRSGLSALGVAPAVAEYVLGHLPPRMVRVYDRHEPMAEAAAALEAWATRLASYVEPEAEGGSVVPFSRERGQ